MTTDFFLNNLIYIILGALFTLNLFLIFWISKLKKRMDVFLQKGEKNLEEVLVSQIEKTKEQEKEIEKIFKELGQLSENSQKSMQKMGLIRFNPFNEVGSDQSFSIALLDLEDSGFVITSHYGKEFSRTYAKPVDKGESGYTLSKEEKEAIKKATV